MLLLVFFFFFFFFLGGGLILQWSRNFPSGIVAVSVIERGEELCNGLNR